MTKEEALIKTRNRFTNLMDGRVMPGVAVTTIIGYYESLLDGSTIQLRKPVSGIESNFQEDEIQEELNEADFWDGDETDKY